MPNYDGRVEKYDHVIVTGEVVLPDGEKMKFYLDVDDGFVYESESKHWHFSEAFKHFQNAVTKATASFDTAVQNEMRRNS